MGREGGKTGRTHLMVGATGLSMAEALTMAAMHNAVEKTAKKSVQLSPAEQQQKGRELDRRRERRELEFDAAQPRGAAPRTSNLIQTVEEGRASPERRETGAQARLRAWCSRRLSAPALTACGAAGRGRPKNEPRSIQAVRVGSRRGCRVQRSFFIRSFGL